ncbi:MAG: transglutaminase-like cysteine peptidase [Pseudomonadota bacterium]
MLRLLRLISVVGCVIAVAACSSTGGSRARLIDGGISSPPPGFITYCFEYAEICGTERRSGQLLAFDFAQLETVNAQVNASIQAQEEARGSDVWRIVSGTETDSSGDCEDYALVKQQRLLALGWPREVLRLAVVKVPGVGAHTVLVVSMPDTDYLLDNLSSEVTPWDQSGYRFEKWQSRTQDLAWTKVSHT